MTLSLNASGDITRQSAVAGRNWDIALGTPANVIISTDSTGCDCGQPREARIVAAGAQDITITTSAASQLPRCDEVANYATSIEVSGGAHVSYLPRERIPLPGAQARFSTELAIATGSSALCWEILALGREGCKETLSFETVESHNRIACDSRVVFEETLRFSSRDAYAVRAMFAGYTHLGNMMIVAPPRTVDVNLLRSLLRPVDMLEVGMSEPVDGVIVVRMLAHDSNTLKRAQWQLVVEARKCLGQEQISLRSINLS